MQEYIKSLVKTEFFSNIDLHFVRFLSDKIKSKETTLAIALLSRAVQNGNTCFSVKNISDDIKKVLEEGKIDVPIPEKWIELLTLETDIINTASKINEKSIKPIIIDGDKLFFQRYFNYEKQIITIIQSLSTSLELSENEKKIIKNRLNDERIFKNYEGEINWQKVATFLAMKNRFSVITGGPGTGKTTTLAKILSILYEGNSNLRIALVAPTGKAATRMGDAVKNIKKKLINEIPEIKDIVQKIPEESGSTIHRLLGILRYSDKFKFNKSNRLPHDILIVDECSMISVSLMAKLLEALKDDARLILLGDQNQLASVEAGQCFGDICEYSNINLFTAKFAKEYKSITNTDIPMGNQNLRSIVQLTKSYRFPDESIVGKVSKCINQGTKQSALEAVKLAKKNETTPTLSGTKLSVIWHETKEQETMLNKLKPIIESNYKNVIDATSPVEALKALEKIKVLGCVKEGPFGVKNLNDRIDQILNRKKMIDLDNIFYENRPIMILKNDYSLKLFNGDIGIIRKDKDGNRRAFFESSEKGKVRSFLPSLLPIHETAHAMTIHKSQGSEFDTVVIVLPDTPSKILTKELIYTGITRTKKNVVIFGTEKVFKGCISRSVERNSGLRDKV